jgi:hypothetical protein
MFRHLYLFSQQSHTSAPTQGRCILFICIIGGAHDKSAHIEVRDRLMVVTNGAAIQTIAALFVA